MRGHNMQNRRMVAFTERAIADPMPECMTRYGSEILGKAAEGILKWIANTPAEKTWRSEQKRRA